MRGQGGIEVERMSDNVVKVEVIEDVGSKIAQTGEV